MGTGTSKDTEVGVPINPRVNYAAEKSKKNKKSQLIDAPILVKVDEGTLRYRYREGEGSVPVQGEERSPGQRKEKGRGRRKAGRIEVAHEGPERAKKHGYFFHSTLNDFSEDANYNKEQSWKFAYVYKGPNKAKQKKVYYVYGKGLKKDSMEEDVTHDPVTKPQGIGYQWPTLYKVAGHVYYDMTFQPDIDENASDDEDRDITEQTDEHQEIRMSVGVRDRVKKLCARLSVRLVKPVISIHLFYQDTELRQDVMMADLLKTDGGDRRRYRIHLAPK